MWNTLTSAQDAWRRLSRHLRAEPETQNAGVKWSISCTCMVLHTSFNTTVLFLDAQYFTSLSSGVLSNSWYALADSSNLSCFCKSKALWYKANASASCRGENNSTSSAPQRKTCAWPVCWLCCLYLSLFGLTLVTPLGVLGLVCSRGGSVQSSYTNLHRRQHREISSWYKHQVNTPATCICLQDSPCLYVETFTFYRFNMICWQMDKSRNVNNSAQKCDVDVKTGDNTWLDAHHHLSLALFNSFFHYSAHIKVSL